MTATRLVLRGNDAMRNAFRQISVAARVQFALVAFHFHSQAAFEHEDETLRGRPAQFAAGFEFGGVLRERRAERRSDMDDGGAGFHARQRGAHERVRR